MTAGPITLLDGGTGTELRYRGIEVPSHVTSLWSAQALWVDPEAVVAVHADYIEAGADVITANNYAVTPPLLAREGLEGRLEELTVLAVELAVRARDATGREVRIAGSLPPLETSYRADLVQDDPLLRDGYRRIVEVLAPRVDVLLCETLASTREADAAVRAARESDCEVWVSWTLQGDWLDHLPSGESVAEAWAAIEPLAPDACLVNCCGANLVGSALASLAELCDRPIGGYANADHVIPDSSGPGRDSERIRRELLDPEGYARAAAGWLASSATLIGGCCGTRPAHIARLRRLIDERTG